MAGFDKMADRVRRRTRPDGVVVDIREPVGDMPVELDGGKIASLNPPTVHLRSGETLRVDGYIQTGTQLAVGDWVGVVRKGGFVLVLGKVVLV